MKIANIELPDRLASRAARRWPRSSWSEVLSHALAQLLHVADLDDYARIDVEAEATAP